MIKKISTLAMAGICLSILGCSDDSEDAVHNVRAEPSLQGSFTDTCSTSSIAGLSEKIRINFEGNKYTRSQIFYAEENCVEEAARVEYSGEFLVGEQNTDDPTKGGTLDLNITEAKVLPTSETVTKLLNVVNYCGNNNYVAGKEVAITGRQTQGLCPLENVPTQLFTVYRLNDDRLFLGDADITTMTDDAAKRSATVYNQKSYVKD